MVSLKRREKTLSSTCASSFQSMTVKRLVVDQLLDPFRDLPQQFLPVQDRRQFVADFIQQRQGLRLLRLRHVKAGRNGISVSQQ